jgi:hypothetical protein
MANGYARLAYETNGVGNEDTSPTLSTKTLFPPLLEFGVEPGASPLERDDELRNVDEPIQVLPEGFAPTWSASSRMYPDVMGFLLKWILGPPVSTAGNGVITDPDGNVIPTGAHRHVFAAPYGPSGPSPVTVSAEIAYVDQAQFFDLRGAACSALALTVPDSGGGRAQASGPACYHNEGTNPSLTPAFESLATPPFMRRHLAIVTWLSGTATTEDWDVAIANPVGVLRTLGIDSAWPDLVEKGDAPIVVSGNIRKRATDTQDFAALIAGTRFAIKARWQSDTNIPTTAYPYRMWLEGDGAQYIGGGPQALANRRRIGAEYPWKLTYDGVGASSTWTLVNATASYA